MCDNNIIHYNIIKSIKSVRERDLNNGKFSEALIYSKVLYRKQNC